MARSMLRRSSHLLLVLCTVLPYSMTQTGVCYTRTSSSRRSVTYNRGSHSAQYCCGWWGWCGERCYRTVYTQNSRVSYYTVYMSNRVCCSGYREVRGRCTPVCSSGCYNGGSCVSPNRCSCARGWTGGNCRTDINECTNRQNNCGTIRYSRCQNTNGGYRCNCIFGTSSARPCQIPPNPRPPTNLQVSQLTSRSATISWRAPAAQTNNRVTGYKLTLDELKFSIEDVSVSLPSSRLSYTFSGLEEFDNYEVEIKSVSEYNFESSVASVSFRTKEAAPAVSPGSLSGSSQGPYSVSLSWTSLPSIHVNGELDHYVVDVSETNTGRVFQRTSTSTTTTVTSLHPHYEYQFRVAAVTSAQGPYSQSIRVTTDESAPTAPPTNIRVSKSSTSLSLTWEPPPSGHRNGVIRHYLLNLLESETSTLSQHQYTSTRAVFNGKHPYYTYRFNISAVTVSTGPYSATQSVRLQEAAPSSAPQNLRGSAVDPTTITLQWSPIPFENRNGLIRTYRVYVRESDTSRSFQRSSSTTSLTLRSLHPDYSYVFQVAPVTVAEGPHSTSITIRTPISTPSTPPVNIRLSSLGPRQILIRWDPPLPANRNGPIVGYLVNITADSIGHTLPQVSTNSTSHTQGSLVPATTYSVLIAAVTDAGSGPFSSVTVITTPEDVPSQPVDPVVSTVTGEPYHLSVSWQPPLEPNGVLLFYTIYCQSQTSDGNVTKVIVVEASGDTTAIFPGLRPYTYYHCFVSCNTSIGEGNFSSVAFAQTDESTPDDAPLFVSAFSNSSDSISLSWSSPKIPNGPIVSYTVIHNETDVNVTQVLEPTTQFEISGLTPFTFYKIILYASTRIGAGPSTSTIIRSAESNPDAPPQRIAATVLSSTEVFVKWLPPDQVNQHGIITRYTIVLTDKTFNVSGTTVSVSDTEYSFTNLQEYAQYSYQIAAATSAGLGPFSAPKNFTTFEDSPSAPPQFVHGVFHSSTAIRFSWSPPPPLHINGVIKYYTAGVTERYTGRVWSFFAVDTLVFVGSLHPYYLYDCVVAAHTVGTGPFSEIYTIQTDEEAPTRPPSIMSSSATSHSVSIAWSPPPFEHTNGLIRYFSVRYYEVETEREDFTSSNTTNITIPGLHPHYTYVCSVAAHTIATGPYSDIIVLTLDEAEPSGPPLNVSGESRSSESISITWIPPSRELQNGEIRYYVVHVTEVITGSLRMINHTTTHRELTVYSLHPYYFYEIRVAAVTVGPGPFSMATVVQTQQDIPTAPVERFSAVVQSFDSVSLSWEPPPAQDQNGMITGYIVRVKETQTETEFNLTTSALNVSVGDLKAFTMYQFNVASFTEVGVGPYSSDVTVTTHQTAPSSAPENLTVSEVSSTTFRLTWAPPPAHTHNGIITHYVINILEVPTGNTSTLTSGTTAITVQFLHPYFVYECSVGAFTVALGPVSEPFTARTLEDVPSGFPQNATIEDLTSQTATVSWEPPAPFERNGVITGYTVYLTEATSDQVTQLPIASTSINIDSLRPFTTYSIAVSASTSVGEGPLGISFSFKTLEDAPSSAPLQLKSHVIDSRTLRLSWSVPEPSDHNGVIRGYHIELYETETDTTQQYETTTTHVVISSLHPDYTYEWSVAAVTVAEGPYSNTVNVTTPEDAPTGFPLDILTTEVNSTKLGLAWKPPSLEQRNGEIIGYRLSIRETTSNSNWTSFTTQSTATVIDDLDPHTVYTIVVAASTAVGTGPYSPSLTVRTLEDAPDSHPTNLTGYALNSTHIHLDWEPPPEDDINGILRQYKVNITEDATRARFQFVTGPDSTHITIGPFHPDYVYHCTVVAYTVREGPHTSILAIRTHEDAPSSGPSDLSTTVLGSSSVAISWSPLAKEDQNGLIRAYKVVLTSVAENKTITLSGDALSLNVSGLRAHTVYVCSVHAVTIDTGPATVSEFITDEDAPTSRPTDISVQAIDPTSLYLSWSPPNEHPNGIIRRYLVNITEQETGIQEHFVTEEMSLTVYSRHPFYHYVCIVSAVTVAPGPWSLSVVTHQPEASPSLPPTEVSITSLTSSSIMFGWKSPLASAVNGVLRGYHLELTDVSTGKSLQVTTKSPYRLFEVLRPFTNYTLRVAAYTVDVGPYSDPVTAATLEDYPDGAPRNVRINITSSRSFQVFWEPPLISERNGIIILYSIQFNNSILSTEFRTDTMQYHITNLRPFTTYLISVSARNSIGAGPSSIPLSVLTPEDAPERPPTSIRVVNVTSTNIGLSWIPPRKLFANGVIRHYIIQIIETNTGKNYSVQTNSQRFHILGDLHPYYTYHLSVQAVTVTMGPWSSPITVTTLQDVPTGPPQQLRADPLDSTSLSLQWSPPPLEQQNGRILRYHIVVTVVDTGAMFEEKTTGYVASLRINSLHPFFTYHIIVAAVNYEGTGPYSRGYQIQMPEDIPSSHPQNLTGEALNSTSLLLTWDPPGYHDQNGVITSFTVTMQEVTTSRLDTHQLQTENFHQLISSLHPYYQYSFRVAANTSVGMGPFSPPISVRTQEDVPSASPQDVKQRFVSSTSIRITWDTPPLAEQNGVIRLYKINLTSPNGEVTIRNTSSMETLLTELHPYSLYIISVAAVTIASGPFSSIIKVSTLQDAPSGSPRSVQAFAMSSTSLNVSWEPPNPSEWNGELVGYLVQVVPSLSLGDNITATAVTVSADNALFIRTGLEVYTSYAVSVAAKTVVGVGPYSEAITVRTLESLPGPPARVAIKMYDHSIPIITLFWEEPKRPNGIILGYRVIYSGYPLDSPSVESDSRLSSGPFTLNFDSTEKKALIDDLLQGYSYNFSVKAETSAGFGPSKTVGVSFKPKDSAQDNLSATPDVKFPVSMGIVTSLLLLVIVILIAFIAFIIWRHKQVKNRLKLGAYLSGTSNIMEQEVHAIGDAANQETKGSSEKEETF